MILTRRRFVAATLGTLAASVVVRPTITDARFRAELQRIYDDCTAGGVHGMLEKAKQFAREHPGANVVCFVDDPQWTSYWIDVYQRTRLDTWPLVEDHFVSQFMSHEWQGLFVERGHELPRDVRRLLASRVQMTREQGSLVIDWDNWHGTSVTRQTFPFWRGEHRLEGVPQRVEMEGHSFM